MTGLFQFPHSDQDEDFEGLPALVPGNAKPGDRQRILDEIIEAWATPLPDKVRRFDLANGVTLNRVWLIDNSRRGEPIDLGELVRGVRKRLDEQGIDDDERSKCVISLRGCRIDRCNFSNLSIKPRFQAFACRFSDEVYFGHAIFGDAASFRLTTFGEGAVFGYATFGEEADFGGATFGEKADFGCASFDDAARFRYATFGERVSFVGASFGEKADFGGATFGEGAYFEGATFGEGAGFRSATFGEKTNFVRASFGKGADFHEAVLDRADLRDTAGLLFDETRIKEVQMLGSAPDPWSRLRRQYTGPWFFIHLLLLIIFFTPYVANVLALTAAAKVQSYTLNLSENLPGDRLDELLKAREEYLSKRREVPAVWILIGGHKGWLFLCMTGIVILYNVLRGYLTLMVNGLRDAEERSGVTPRLEEYYGVRHPFSEHNVLSAVLRTWWHNARKRKFLPVVALRHLPKRWVITLSVEESIEHGEWHSFLECVGLYRLHRLGSWIIWGSIISTAINLIYWVFETKIWI